MACSLKGHLRSKSWTDLEQRGNLSKKALQPSTGRFEMHDAQLCGRLFLPTDSQCDWLEQEVVWWTLFVYCSALEGAEVAKHRHTKKSRVLSDDRISPTLITRWSFSIFTFPSSVFSFWLMPTREWICGWEEKKKQKKMILRRQSCGHELGSIREKSR